MSSLHDPSYQRFLESAPPSPAIGCVHPNPCDCELCSHMVIDWHLYRAFEPLPPESDDEDGLVVDARGRPDVPEHSSEHASFQPLALDFANLWNCFLDELSGQNPNNSFPCNEETMRQLIRFFVENLYRQLTERPFDIDNVVLFVTDRQPLIIAPEVRRWFGIQDEWLPFLHEFLQDICGLPVCVITHLETLEEGLSRRQESTARRRADDAALIEACVLEGFVPVSCDRYMDAGRAPCLRIGVTPPSGEAFEHVTSQHDLPEHSEWPYPPDYLRGVFSELARTFVLEVLPSL